MKNGELCRNILQENQKTRNKPNKKNNDFANKLFLELYLMKNVYIGTIIFIDVTYNERQQPRCDIVSENLEHFYKVLILIPFLDMLGTFF